MEFWAQRIQGHLEDTRRIFVMVNNHYEGFSPLTCQRLGRLLGVDLKLPSLARHAARPGAVPAERDEQLGLF